MQLQIPNGKLTIGNALDGFIGQLYLCSEAYNVPQDPSNFENCLVDTKFIKGYVDNTTLVNNGTGGNMTLSGVYEF